MFDPETLAGPAHRSCSASSGAVHSRSSASASSIALDGKQYASVAAMPKQIAPATIALSATLKPSSTARYFRSAAGSTAVTSIVRATGRFTLSRIGVVSPGGITASVGTVRYAVCPSPVAMRRRNAAA